MIEDDDVGRQARASGGDLLHLAGADQGSGFGGRAGLQHPLQHFGAGAPASRASSSSDSSVSWATALGLATPRPFHSTPTRIARSRVAGGTGIYPSEVFRLGRPARLRSADGSALHAGWELLL